MSAGSVDAPRTAPSMLFHPSASGGLCSSTPSSAVSLPPRRCLIRSVTSPSGAT